VIGDKSCTDWHTQLLSYGISQHGNEVELTIRLVAQDFYEVSVTLNNSFQLLCPLYIIRKITWIELHLKLKLCAQASFFSVISRL